MAVATVEATEAVEVAEGKAAVTEAEATEEGGSEVAKAEAATAEAMGTEPRGVRSILFYRNKPVPTRRL